MGGIDEARVRIIIAKCSTIWRRPASRFMVMQNHAGWRRGSGMFAVAVETSSISRCRWGWSPPTRRWTRSSRCGYIDEAVRIYREDAPTQETEGNCSSIDDLT